MSLDTQTRSSDLYPVGDPGATGPLPHWPGEIAEGPSDPFGMYTGQTLAGPAHTGPFAGPPTGPASGPIAVRTTAGAFAVLDASVRLRDVDHATVGVRRDHVESVLRAVFRPQSTLPLVGVAAIGSAGRDTMIRPLDEVDVFAVFSAVTGAWKRFRFDSGGLLEAVRTGLGPDHVEVIGSRGKALRLVYGEPPDVHLIPAFDHPRAGYVMPDGVGGWLPTRPERHASWMADFGPATACAVRLLKFWNRVCGSHLRSFHLEALAGSRVGGRGLDTRQALHEVFVMGERSLEAYDPAGVGSDLSCYLSDADRAAVARAFAFARTHAGQAVAAEAVGDHEEAISMWRVVFGPALPAFG